MDFKKSYEEKLKIRCENFKNDINKEKRLSEQLCRKCFYIYDNLGFSAMTKSNCKNCNQEMLFGSSLVDDLCKDCARKLNLCKHCNNPID